MEPDEAYLAGYTLGDGNLYSRAHVFSLDPRKTLREYEITWADADPEQLKTVAEIVKNSFAQSVNLRLKKREKAQCWILKCKRKTVFEWLQQLLQEDHEVQRPEIMSNFIGGFFDAEGCVHRTLNRRYKEKAYYKIRLSITQKDRDVLETMKRMLSLNFGISSNIQKKWNQDAYMLQVEGKPNAHAFIDKIGFRNVRKREKLTALLCS